MKNRRFLLPLSFLLIAAVLSLIVMLLWNCLMPILFGLITINYWQALGIFLLARILFGGGGRIMNKMFHPHHHHNPIHDKWMKMTPEQRKEFVHKRRQFGHGGPFDRSAFDREQDKENG